MWGAAEPAAPAVEGVVLCRFGLETEDEVSKFCLELLQTLQTMNVSVRTPGKRQRGFEWMIMRRDQDRDRTTHLLNDLLCTKTTVRLNLHVELVRLRIVVKRYIISRRLLLLRVFAEWPLISRVVLVPVGRVPELVMRVVLE